MTISFSETLCCFLGLIVSCWCSWWSLMIHPDGPEGVLPGWKIQCLQVANGNTEHIPGLAFVVGTLSVSAGFLMCLLARRNSPAQRRLRMISRTRTHCGSFPPTVPPDCQCLQIAEGLFQFMEKNRNPRPGICHGRICPIGTTWLLCVSSGERSLMPIGEIEYFHLASNCQWNSW